MSMRAPRRFLSILLVAALAAFAAGCATVRDAPLKENEASVDIGGEALLFMTARVTNSYRPSYAPRILVVRVQAATGDMETFSFKVANAYDSGPSYYEHLVAFKLAPGRYQVRQIQALARSFPVIGSFAVPIYQMIDIKGPGTYYLGHLDATVVERKDETLLRAGPVIPLIDQGVAGASGGTFLVKIDDRLADDMRILGSRYPALNKMTVEKLLLQPWRQPSESEMESLKK